MLRDFGSLLNRCQCLRALIVCTKQMKTTTTRNTPNKKTSHLPRFFSICTLFLKFFLSVYVLLLLLVFSPVHCILICVDGSCELNTYIHFNGISVNRTHKTHNKIKRKQNQQNKR